MYDHCGRERSFFYFFLPLLSPSHLVEPAQRVSCQVSRTVMLVMGKCTIIYHLIFTWPSPACLLIPGEIAPFFFFLIFSLEKRCWRRILFNCC